jgi:hypothetical protein
MTNTATTATWDVLKEFGFAPDAAVISDVMPGLSYDFGNFKLSASAVMGKYFRPVVFFTGVLATPRTLAEVCFELPRMAALECIARDVVGDPNATLGELLKKHPDTIPPPLDVALSKIWGFACDRARHLREDQPPRIEEAELVVGLVGAVSVYLLKKLNDDTPV